MLTAALLSAVALGSACRRDAPPTPTSQPVAQQASGEPLVIGAGPVPDPVSGQALAARWPSLGALAPLDLRVVEGVFNLLPGPCQPCEEAGQSLAECAVAPPVGCENMAELVARAARLASAGVSTSALRATLTYGGPWLPEPTIDSPGWPDPAAPVQVELWLDPTWGPWREAVAHAEALVALGQADPVVGALAVHVRLLPTWSLREDRAPPPGGPEVHAALAAADQLGLGLPFASALAAQGELPDNTGLAAIAGKLGVDPAAWQAAVDGAGARLARDAAAVQALSLRSAPSWRVDGYRLRGHRGLDGLRDLVENQQLDHLDPLPAALLATRPGSAP